MAQYVHLEIYKTMYEFIVYFAHLFKYYEKEYRYTIGENILNTSLEFMILMYKANSARTSEDRLKYLDAMGDKIQLVYILLRISNSLKCVSREKYSNCCVYLDNVLKQLSGWQSYTFSNKTKEEIENMNK